MNTENTSTDILQDVQHDRPKMTQGLNVLTILTFIGCALQLLGGIWSYTTAQSNYDGKDKLIEQLNSGTLPSWAKAMMGDPANMIATITKSFENRIPILVLTLVATVLCFVGALQMRKLKKQGFLLYTIGELLPFLTMGIFIGTFSMSGIGFFIGLCIALLFVLLYAMQRKNLTV